MVTATFFAPPKADGAEDTRLEDGVAHSEEERARATQQAVALARTPMLTAFDASAEYVYLEQLDPTSAEQWAVLHFESPVRGRLSWTRATAACLQRDAACAAALT